MPRPSWIFTAFSAAVAVLLAGACLYVASLQWFSKDDLRFLTLAQREDLDWLRIFFWPWERFNWAYRPLGEEAFFTLCFRLFGLDAFGYLALALAAHFATGLLALRIGLQLGLGMHAAIVAGLLVVSRYAGVREVFYSSAFFYASANLFFALSVTLFLDAGRRRSLALRLLSALAFVAALMSCESALTLPAILVALSLYVDDGGRIWPRLRDALRESAPHLLVAALYVPFRLAVVDPDITNRMYAYELTSRTPVHAWYLIQWAAGDEYALPLAGALAIALGLVMASREGRALARRCLVPLALVCGVWVIADLSPFMAMRYIGIRHAIPLVVPLCLLAGGVLAVLVRMYGRTDRTALELAVLVVVVASLPIGALRERERDPLGERARDLVEIVRSGEGFFEESGAVVVIYAGPGLADQRAGRALRRELYGGHKLLRAAFPHKKLWLKLAEEGDVPTGRDCIRCFYLYYTSDKEFRRGPVPRPGI